MDRVSVIEPLHTMGQQLLCHFGQAQTRLHPSVCLRGTLSWCYRCMSPLWLAYCSDLQEVTVWE